MKKRIPILIAVVAVVLAVLLVPKLWRRDDPNRIVASGNIELTEVDVAFKTAGKIVELAVDEGSAVTKGQLIARLDRLRLSREQSRDQAGVLSAETQLGQVITGIRFQRASLEGDLALRRADLEQAEARLQELLNGSRPQEIQQARAAVEEARTAYRQASEDWTRAQTLYKNDDISTAQRDQYRARFDQTAAALRRAEEAMALVSEGPRKEQIAQARAAVERARAAVRVSEAGRIDLQRREQEIATRKAEIERARAQVGVTESQIEDTTVVSPVDGVVLVKSAEQGEVVAAGASVVRIGDVAHPWLRGYVSEQNLGKVKLGMQAAVRSDSYPGKVYQGRISFISAEAEFTPKQIQTPEERVKLVYRIKIDVANPAGELKSNMPVEAEIRLNGSQGR